MEKLFNLIHKLGLTKYIARYSMVFRKEILSAVSYNSLLLTHEMVPFDLLTDTQIFNILRQPFFLSKGHFETDFIKLEKKLKKHFPYKHIFPLSGGRSAEWFLSELLDRKGKVIVSNSLFPTTRIHLEIKGARIIECSCEESKDLNSNFPFKGNLNIQGLNKIILEEGAGNIAGIYLETADNAQAGQPFSLRNLEEVSLISKKNSIPLILDGCRIIDQALMIKRREKEFMDKAIVSIVETICQKTDIITMSLAKNFIIEEGAFIGFNNDSFKEKMQDLLMIMGDGLSLRQKAVISRVVSKTFKNNFKKIIRRAKVSELLWEKLKEALVPVVRPNSTFAVYIDGNELKNNKELGKYPLKSFISELFIRSGILVSESMVSPTQEQQGISMLRVIIPLDSVSIFSVNYIAKEIAKLWNDKENIIPLKEIEIGNSKSFIYTAKFERKAKVV